MRKSPVANFLTAAFLTVAITGAASAQPAPKTPLSIVLVHGAFENSSIWNKVIAILQHRGIKVVAAQNPLTSLEADAQNTTRLIDDQPGNVLLVGHSYGGVVITEAGANSKVKALVYVAGASPNSGQSGLDEASAYPKPALLGHLFVDKQGMAYATDEGIEDLAQDVPGTERGVLLATQGPIAFAAFQGKVSHAAWETKPSWSIVADKDRAISPQEEADSGARIKAKVTHLQSGHEVMLTKPQQVADVILQAYQAVMASHR
jgi:pimeloyl-ACP methyl ester carboxylesterase